MSLLGIAAIKTFFNCPVHDDGTFSRQVPVSNFQQLKELVVSGLNQDHIMSIYSFDGSDYDVSYVAGGHTFIGAKITVDDTSEFMTEDNGSGKLIWRQVK